MVGVGRVDVLEIEDEKEHTNRERTPEFEIYDTLVVK